MSCGPLLQKHLPLVCGRIANPNPNTVLNISHGRPLEPDAMSLADTTTHAPDSPRPSQSPPPTGVQGDLELELLGLATALYNLGTTVINDSTKERDKPKPVGARA